MDIRVHELRSRSFSFSRSGLWSNRHEESHLKQLDTLEISVTHSARVPMRMSCSAVKTHGRSTSRIRQVFPAVASPQLATQSRYSQGRLRATLISSSCCCNFCFSSTWYLYGRNAPSVALRESSPVFHLEILDLCCDKA